ncbi:hypothetical protein [Bacillus pumilus]|uniref:hypothetical protein n=1 Tax=Bacillus pumilus TaxID=1408 RepID=UPI0011A9DC08|nr:hypothetical protein [Bacillus pumilus]
MSGKFRKDGRFDDIGGKDRVLEGEGLLENVEKVEKVKGIGECKKGETGHVGVGWVLGEEGMDGIIGGGKGGEQVEEKVKRKDVELRKEEINEIEEILC